MDCPTDPDALYNTYDRAGRVTVSRNRSEAMWMVYGLNKQKWFATFPAAIDYAFDGIWR